MCPPKPYVYTSEDYLNIFLDKYSRKRIEDARNESKWIRHLIVELAIERVEKNKIKRPAWHSPYPLFYTPPLD